MVPDAGMAGLSPEARGFRDGITYHLQGAESGRQCETHNAPAQKPTLFLERQGIYLLQTASSSRQFFNRHTFIQQIFTEDLLHARHHARH